MSSNRARWLIVALVAAAISLMGTAMAGAATAPTPPTATTGPATGITATGATLNGMVNPNKTQTTYYFQYGKTTTYGHKTPVATVNGNAAKAVSAKLTGIPAGTAFHYRLVAANSAGTVDGKDATFTTLAAGPSKDSVSVQVLPATIIWGKATTVSGAVTGPMKAGRTVTLKASPYPYTSAFKATGQTTKTSASGAYSFTVRPGKSTRYEVTVATKVPVTSSQVGVRVRVKVIIHMSTQHPHVGQLVRFFGTVTPAHDGRYAQIQRRTSTGAWKTVASTRLRPGGTVNGVAVSHFSRKIRIRHSGTYRVRVNPRDGDHMVGNSATRREIVH